MATAAATNLVSPSEEVDCYSDCVADEQAACQDGRPGPGEWHQNQKEDCHFCDGYQSCHARQNARRYQFVVSKLCAELAWSSQLVLRSCEKQQGK